MISVDEALSIIENHILPIKNTEQVPVQDAFERILTDDVVAKRDVPRFDNSAMDGFVLRQKDWDSGQRSYKIAFEIRPENNQVDSLEDGMCARILTGARVPQNGDLVIPVELADEQGNMVHFDKKPDFNSIRRQGEGYSKGKIVLKKDSLLRAQEIGLLIESGNQECSVLKPIRVAIQVTGNEIDDEMNTNGPILTNLTKKWPNTIVTEWPVLSDNFTSVLARFRELKNSADLILTTGGISAGKHDYLFPALEELGAKCIIRKVNQKPGKPFTMHIWDDIPICNLPGNPISAVFTAEMYARKVLNQMVGLKAGNHTAFLKNPVSNPGDRTVFSPGKIEIVDGKLVVQTDGKMKSHLLQLLESKHVFARIEPGESLRAGDLVPIVPFTNSMLALL